jgi:glycolate oxidase iron-sulfur subunit
MTACPSGVDYGKLIEAARAQIERHHERPAMERLYRKMILGLFPDVARLRRMRPLLRFYQRSGLRKMVRGLKLLDVLPEQFSIMEALLPPLGDAQEIPPVTPAQGVKRKRVGLLLGCVQREFLPHINAATVRVLAAEGCEVVAPREQTCCGALLAHAGEEAPALALAKKVIDAFDRAGVDAIITNAGGCGSNVRDYAWQLRDDPVYADRARRFSEKCRDVAEFLAELGPRAIRHPVKMRVAYHDSCHLQHAQEVRTQPRELLAAIPGLGLADLPEGALCCGSAGIFNLVQPETARQLADRKADHITRLAPGVVATGNAGCLLQIGSALARRGSRIRVLHTVELLDASIRGVRP